MEFWLDVETNITLNGYADGIMWKSRQKQKNAHRYIDNDDAAGLGGFIQNVHVQVEWIYLHQMLMLWNTHSAEMRINGGDQVMFSKVDECDEEGRTGLIHATLQGKVGLICYYKVKNYCVARSNVHFRYYKWCLVNQENMVEVLLDGSADIEVGFLFVVMRFCSRALIIIHLLKFKSPCRVIMIIFLSFRNPLKE